MTDEFRAQLISTLGLKETGELLDIWKTNDRVEWSDLTFEVIREILTSRGVELPEQDEAVLEHPEEDEQPPEYGFTPEELKIIDDENPPDFYDPFRVLQLTKWMDWLVKAYIVLIVLYNLSRLPATIAWVGAYFPQSPKSIGVYLAAAVIQTINVGIAVVIYTAFFKVLAGILRILMQMEFNSRRAGSTEKTA